MRHWTSSMSAPRSTRGFGSAGVDLAEPCRACRDVQLSPREVQEVGGEDGQAEASEGLGELLGAPAAADPPGPGRAPAVPGGGGSRAHDADQRAGLLLAPG